MVSRIVYHLSRAVKREAALGFCPVHNGEAAAFDFEIAAIWHHLNPCHSVHIWVAVSNAPPVKGGNANRTELSV